MAKLILCERVEIVHIAVGSPSVEEMIETESDMEDIPDVIYLALDHHVIIETLASVAPYTNERT